MHTSMGYFKKWQDILQLLRLMFALWEFRSGATTGMNSGLLLPKARQGGKVPIKYTDDSNSPHNSKSFIANFTTLETM